MGKRLIFVDTETTGLSAAQGHRVVELAAVEVIEGKLTGRRFHTYLNPQRLVDPGARRVHGLSDAFLAKQPRFSEIAARFMDFIEGAECLMHNAPFDCAFLDAELQRVGYGDRLRGLASVTCTLSLARKRFPGARCTLDALMDRAQIGLMRQEHSALEDAELLAEIYLKILSSAVDDSRVAPTPARETTATARKAEIQTSLPPIAPAILGMAEVIRLTRATHDTFYYRGKNKRIIDFQIIDGHRWERIMGPLVYAVTDHTGAARYIGKWESDTPLYSRWLRHNRIHHQERARNQYICELDAGRGPLSVWSISVAELRPRLPSTMRYLDDKHIAIGLEALWIDRWKESLVWNKRPEPLLADVQDGEYWKK